MEKTAIKIVQQLQDAGFKAYWAGGCVRDMLMEVIPVDYDIATSATPDEIEKILSKSMSNKIMFFLMFHFCNEWYDLGNEL